MGSVRYCAQCLFQNLGKIAIRHANHRLPRTRGGPLAAIRREKYQQALARPWLFMQPIAIARELILLLSRAYLVLDGDQGAIAQLRHDVDTPPLTGVALRRDMCPVAG